MELLFADEDFPTPVVKRLRELGHDVLTTQDAGLAGIGTDDADILAEATRIGRCVLTMNRRDFIALHAIDSRHSGIIVCKRDGNTNDLADRIHAVITMTSKLEGQLIRVNRVNAPPKTEPS